MLNRRRPQLLAFRVAFWATLFVIGLLLFLDRRPLVLRAKDAGRGGEPTRIESEGTFAVVVDPGVIAGETRSGNFERSWAWIDTLRQEVGPVTTLSVDDLRADRLRDFGVVIVTESANRSPRIQSRTTELESFANSGGTLVLELPTATVRETFAADGAGGWRTPAEISAVENAAPSTADRLIEMPLLTRYIGSTRPMVDSTTLLAMDGTPVVYSRRSGRGRVVVFDFNVAAQVAAMQQGLPGRKMRVHPRRAGDVIRTADLAAAPSLGGTLEPYADTLEAWSVHNAIGFGAPVFYFWPWPDGGKGALISSHDSRHFDGRPLWMSAFEHIQGGRTTTFVSPPARRMKLEDVPDEDQHSQLELLWVLDPRDGNVFRRYGIFGIHPIVQPLSLTGQLNALKRTLGEDAVVNGVRIWDGRWARRFTEPFRAIDAAGFDYSVTYQPAPNAPQGYTFGTCQPFTPMDTNGLPFSIQEIPVCFANPNTREEAARALEALRLAAEGGWALHLLTSSDRFHESPSMTTVDVWRAAVQQARDSEMWMGGTNQLVRFWQRRTASALRVTSSRIEHRIDGRGIDEMRFTVEVNATGSGMALTLPETSGGVQLLSVTRGGLGGDPARRSEVATVERDYYGNHVRLVELERGESTYSIRYGHP